MRNKHLRNFVLLNLLGVFHWSQKDMQVILSMGLGSIGKELTKLHHLIDEDTG